MKWIVFSILSIAILMFSGFYVTSADVSSYPEVLVFTSIDASNPEECDFKVFEEGEEFPIYGFKVGAREDRNEVDFIFVFDITGSMEDEIDTMKEKSKEFADLVAKFGFDYRFSLVTFRDEVVKGDYGFTKSVDEFKSWLSSLRASGGGDTPEAALDALTRAMRLPVRKDAQKVLILITDAPYHYKGDGTPYSRYTVEDVRYMMRKFGFSIYSVSPDTKQYRDLVIGFGKIFDISSKGSFASILNDVVKSFVRQVSFKYKTVERSPGEKVNFVVKAACHGKGILEASGTYEVPPKPTVEEFNVVAEGMGVVNADDPSKATQSDILMARRAAIVDAQRLILEYLKGVKLDSKTTVADAIVTSDTVRTAVEGLVKHALIVSENYDEKFGIYEVKMKVNFKTVVDAYKRSPGYVYVWHENFIKARGVAPINRKFRPIGRAILMARRAAIALAQRELLEAVKGVHIDAETTVDKLSNQHDIVVARVEGLLKGAFIIEESSREEAVKNGYYWVEMGVHVVGDRSVYKAVKEFVRREKPSAPVLKPRPVEEKGKVLKEKKMVKSFPAPIPITSLIVEIKGKVKFTLKGYTIISKSGKVIFSPDMVESPDILPGQVVYSKLQAKALGGDNPYFVKAFKVEGDKIYVEADEDFLKATFAEDDIRKRGMVIILSEEGEEL